MENKPFYFTAIISQEILDKIDVDVFQILGNTLSGHIRLNKYGSTVNGMSFIFILVDPDDGFHEECLEYKRKDKDIRITHRLPGSELLQAAPEEVLPLLAASFLASIEKYPALKLKDFDHRHFREDVQQLFEKKGWLVGQEV